MVKRGRFDNHRESITLHSRGRWVNSISTVWLVVQCYVGKKKPSGDDDSDGDGKRAPPKFKQEMNILGGKGSTPGVQCLERKAGESITEIRQEPGQLLWSTGEVIGTSWQSFHMLLPEWNILTAFPFIFYSVKNQSQSRQSWPSWVSVLTNQVRKAGESWLMVPPELFRIDERDFSPNILRVLPE